MKSLKIAQSTFHFKNGDGFGKSALDHSQNKMLDYRLGKGLMGIKRRPITCLVHLFLALFLGK